MANPQDGNQSVDTFEMELRDIAALTRVRTQIESMINRYLAEENDKAACKILVQLESAINEYENQGYEFKKGIIKVLLKQKPNNEYQKIMAQRAKKKKSIAGCPA